MFIHEAYIDFNGETYRLGTIKVNDEDFSQYPAIELLDPVKDIRLGMLPIYQITTEHLKPKGGVFENTNHVVRTIIQTIDNLDIKHLLVRTSRTKSKGDMLERI